MGNKTVLMVGASGLVGGEVLRMLIEAPAYEKIVLLNRREISAVTGHSKVIQLQANFDELHQIRDSLQADDVICTLGTTIKKAGSQAEFRKVDFTYPLQIAKIAQANGARHFLIVTASGANPNAKIFYNRVKGEIETAIRELNYPETSIFRPSLLLGPRTEKRFGEDIAQKLSPLLSFLLPLRYKPVPARVVAQAILAATRQKQPGFRIYESDEIQRLGK